MERDLKPLRAAIDRYATTVEQGDAKLSMLQKMMKKIEERDRKNRAIGAERTFMIPDNYSGGDTDALRQKVEEILKKKYAKALKLRVTLPAENWKEESVVEWTDTTKTVVQHRNTRFMTTQVAAKGADGKVYLHSIHLACNRQSDGNWGPFYGHIMWTDWMAEKNVNKAPPGK